MWGGLADVFFRDSSPCLPKGFPLYTLLRYSYLVADPLAFGAKKTNFEGERAPKNAIFW